MLETYTNEQGVECCDNCNEAVEECVCACVVCGEQVAECSCDEGPAYPAVAEN